jgi:hypothetical protein
VKSSRHGKSTSISVENITPFGIWLFVSEKEYFLSFDEYPYFHDQSIAAIQNVRLLHGFHLFWPDLDVDLEIDNLENPEKYPLKSKVYAAKSRRIIQTGKATSTR